MLFIPANKNISKLILPFYSNQILTLLYPSLSEVAVVVVAVVVAAVVVAAVVVAAVVAAAAVAFDFAPE